MDNDFQERQHGIGAEGRFAASISAIHHNSQNETGSVDPWLVHFGRLREGFLQTAYEKVDTLKLFSIECILPRWRATSLVALPSALFGYMRRTLRLRGQSTHTRAGAAAGCESVAERRGV